MENNQETIMNIDDLTIGQAKELAGLFAHTSSGDGKWHKYMNYTGAKTDLGDLRLGWR